MKALKLYISPRTSSVAMDAGELIAASGGEIQEQPGTTVETPEEWDTRRFWEDELLSTDNGGDKE
ncbi:MAG: hypothetical protein J6M53_07555 [Bacteroidaceae bacterium]|nr:hypothetical protein [Bacteroidaceae bacterium]